MSNDQSPPARKVIPYKKGGPRKSPFADMAFQFSGTALDVAIQQREEVVEDTSSGISETPVKELSEDGTDTVNPPAPEVEAIQPVREEAPEPPQSPEPVFEQESFPSPPPIVRSQARQRRHPRREVRLVPDKKSRSDFPEVSDPQLLAFITRWKPFLTETQLAVCIYIYDNSVAVGREFCFTSTPRLMIAVSKTQRQIKTVVNQLIDWGFLAKGETIVNAPREERGTYYKLIMDKS